MPTTIGVRQLKNQTSRVVRAVREEMTEYVVTLRGEPVAVLRPLTEDDAQRLRQAEIDETLADMGPWRRKSVQPGPHPRALRNSSLSREGESCQSSMPASTLR